MAELDDTTQGPLSVAVTVTLAPVEGHGRDEKVRFRVSRPSEAGIELADEGLAEQVSDGSQLMHRQHHLGVLRSK